MNMSPNFTERWRGTWRVANRIKHDDLNHAAWKSQICSILAEVEADNIQKDHREVHLTEALNLLVPVLAHQFLESIFNDLHVSPRIIYQNIGKIL
jgi:hypothetical protein